MNRKQWTLGVMVWLPSGIGQNPRQLPEDRFCRLLCSRGADYDLNVFVFSPVFYDEPSDSLHGYRLMDGEWSYVQCPLPDAVYDRCSYRTRLERLRSNAAMEKLKRRKSFVRLGTGLPGKDAVYRALSKEPDVAALIPHSRLYRDGAQLARLLSDEAGGLFLKPDAGMQGRGVLRIIKDAPSNLYTIRGRTAGNRTFAASCNKAESCFSFVERVVAGRNYLIQPYLRLTDSDNVPFDIRVLVQKEARGQWSVTGLAMRCGSSESVTANLHGGGTAKAAEPALVAMFGKQTALRLLSELQRVSLLIAHRLEEAFGRLHELGIDFGIEPDGRIWLLEVNSKPGRSVFALSMQSETAELSVIRPLQYARLLCVRGSGSGPLHLTYPISH